MSLAKPALRVILVGKPGKLMRASEASLRDIADELATLSAQVTVVDGDDAYAADDGASDVVFITAGMLLPPGTLSEMVAIAALDPMFAFVAPRTNDGDLSALPHSDSEHVGALGDRQRFDALTGRLPRFGLVPFVELCVLWVDGRVLAELGPVDVHRLPATLSALQMRASRCGYRTVLAHHAYAWRTPMGHADHTTEDDVNTGFPERAILRARHIESPAYTAESLLAELLPSANGPVVTFDLSSFAAHHNGTFEAGLRLIEASVREWPMDWMLRASMSDEAWDFHRMARLPRLTRTDPDDPVPSTAILRIGQPFTARDLDRLFTRAPVVAIYMLDTISYDCGYIAVDFDPEIWRIALESSDLILTNSDYTLERIRTRFALGDRVATRVSRHSLDPAEYAPPGKATPAPAEGGIFVLGNQYAHKFVGPTVDAIAADLPQAKIIAVGYPGDRTPPPNALVHTSGGIDQDVFERFYADAQVVVFPSHYEGFGFPILHALARRRPIFVRDTALNRELAARIASSGNIHFYATTASLVSALKTPPVWTDELLAGETGGWARSAHEVQHALETAMAKASSAVIVERLRRIAAIKAMHDAHIALLPRGHRVAMRLGPLLERGLKTRMVAWGLSAFDRLRRRKPSHGSR
jgi:hypothetical protein